MLAASRATKVGCVVQGEELQPAGQAGRNRRDLDPHLVDGELPRWEPAQAGVFRDPDPVLDPGVGAVEGFEEPKLGPATIGTRRQLARASTRISSGAVVAWRA
jgi:hypothetical protein